MEENKLGIMSESRFYVDILVFWPSRGIASEVCGNASAIMSENTDRDSRIVTPETW